MLICLIGHNESEAPLRKHGWIACPLCHPYEFLALNAYQAGILFFLILRILLSLYMVSVSAFFVCDGFVTN